MRSYLAGIMVCCCAVLPNLARGQTPDPLRLIPDSADAVAKIESPRALYDAVYGHELFQDLLKLDVVAALYDTATFRRVEQVLAYFEKELGRKRLDLLDQLAGGGAAIAARFDQKAVLVVVQARDEELLAKFVSLTRSIVNQ